MNYKLNFHEFDFYVTNIGFFMAPLVEAVVSEGKDHSLVHSVFIAT